MTERPTPTPQATSATVRANMSAQGRGRDTAPELALRRELHRRGLRFRVDWPLPGIPRRRADIAFTRAHLAVMVDGCYWHGCPVHSRPTRQNTAWWQAKVARNQARDADTDARLRAAGWAVVRAWEHEDVKEVADLIEAIVRGGRPPRAAAH